MNKNVKEWLIVLSIWIPLIVIIAGSIMYLNGIFDETSMEELFPALFFGIGVGWWILNLTSDMFPHLKWAVVSGLVAFAATVTVSLCVSTNAGMVVFGAVGIGTAVIVAIKGIIKRIFRL